jgi:hypothetical protein
MPNQTQTARDLTPVVIALLTPALLADSPKLNIRTKNHLPAEEQRKQQLERLARQYDLSNWSGTGRGTSNCSRTCSVLFRIWIIACRAATESSEAATSTLPCAWIVRWPGMASQRR